MSASVKATIDNRDETIYLNLDLAVRIERPQTRDYTIIQFVSGAGSQTVKETPEELLTLSALAVHAELSIGKSGGKRNAACIAAKHNIYKFYRMTVMMLLSFHAKKNKAQERSIMVVSSTRELFPLWNCLRPLQ